LVLEVQVKDMMEVFHQDLLGMVKAEAEVLLPMVKMPLEVMVVLVVQVFLLQ
tara:strand:+ start:272 stop:427 length:156 start_codon:yes stop_codon:yes gene_type:complete